jgi:phospholipase D1/2
LAVVLTALTAVWRFTPLAEFITPDRIADWARVVRESRMAPILLVVAHTVGAFIMFPRPLLTLLAVLAFGPLLGFLYTMLGILAATLATYYAGRFISYDTVRRFAGKRLDPVTKVVREHGLLAVFLASFVPAPPFVVQGLIAGAIRVKVWHYTVGTLLGMLPGTLATTYFGHEITTALEDPSQISYPVIIAVIAVFAVSTYLARRWYANQTAPKGA